MLLLLTLLTSNPALAQSVPPPAPAPTTGARPTQLEALIGDMDHSLPGNRSYAVRELLRRVRMTQRIMKRGSSDTMRVIEARVDRADHLAQVGPAAAACVRNYPEQAAGCAKLLGALGDPQWVKTLETARPVTSPRTQKQIDQALARLTVDRP
ncbi:MAG: hypothetical protein AB8H79_07195 [Myxococcota bacterium]